MKGWLPVKKYTVAVLFLLIASLLFSAAFAESLPEEEPVEEPTAEEILAEIDTLEFEYPRPVGAETLYVGMSSNEMIGKVFIVFTDPDVGPEPVFLRYRYGSRLRGACERLDQRSPGRRPGTEKL